jgi:tetratricopeptide (TPR) repeat protein
MKTSLPHLDDQELIRLAFEASVAKRHGDAIEYLKQVVEKSPQNFMAIYLLGAEHAQLRLADRAIDEFNRALAIQPGLHPARFQLGLLLLTKSRVEEALAAFELLGKLGEDSPFHHFGQGMVRLCRDDFAGGAESLRRGMAANTTIPVLNNDIQRILDRISARMAGKVDAGQQPAARAISAYTKEIN